jgi:uncharacterized membrane protein
MAIALIFGVGALNYPIGRFSHAGAGMFPLLISCMLFLIGLISVVRSRFVEAEPLKFNTKNVALVLLGLCGFALISAYLNMIAAIVFLVFCVSHAGTSYSVARNLKISAGLIAIAFAFQQLLGMQLPLFKWIS